MRPYLTRAGDVLDAVCKSELGSEAHLATVLSANPGLAAWGPVLPEGLILHLPEANPAPVARGRIRLWGRT